MEVKYLYDEVLTLKMAIEEAIMTDYTNSGMTADDELDSIEVKGGSGLIGWVDDI
jgi:hypothetical protein